MWGQVEGEEYKTIELLGSTKHDTIRAIVTYDITLVSKESYEVKLAELQKIVLVSDSKIWISKRDKKNQSIFKYYDKRVTPETRKLKFWKGKRSGRRVIGEHK